MSAIGNGAGFSGVATNNADGLAAETVHFTISGLSVGQSLVLNGYKVKDNNGERIDLYYVPALPCMMRCREWAVSMT